MGERETLRPAIRPVAGRACIVMVCADLGEADEVSRQLLELNNGFLVAYRRVEDIANSPPAGRVVLVILACGRGRSATGALRWLSGRWPDCTIAVVGNAGADDMEIEARVGGALYFARPVSPRQWSDLLRHVLDKSAATSGLPTAAMPRPKVTSK